jgi:hypothetical protein
MRTPLKGTTSPNDHPNLAVVMVTFTGLYLLFGG